MRTILIALVGITFVLCLPVSGNAQGDGRLFRSSFPQDLLKDVTKSEAIISTNFLIKRVVEGKGYASEAVWLDTHKELLEAIRADEIDCFLILSSEYLRHKDTLGMVPQVSPSYHDNDPRSTFLLLTKPGVSLSDIQDGKLLIQSGSGEMPMIWLRSLLRKAGRHEDEVFSEIEVQPTVGKAVLPLFFGKADAVICLDHSYDVLNELNPQIGARTEIIEKSEPILSSILCLRAKFEEWPKGLVKKVAGELHETPGGRQLLTFMGVKKFVPFKDSDLDGVRRLLEQKSDPVELTDQGGAE